MTETTSVSSYEFVGQFPEEKRLSFARYMVSLPSYNLGRTLMIEGRLRDTSLRAIDWDNQAKKYVVKNRSFRNITGHELTVMSALHSTAHLLGFDDDVVSLADSVGYAHDTTKPMEIVTRAYRMITRDDSSTYSEKEREQARLVFEQWLSFYGISSTMLSKNIEELEILEFESLFNQQINIPILKRILSGKVTEPLRNTIIDIASSDMWDKFSRIIVITEKLLREHGIQTNETNQFNNFADRLKSEGKLPKSGSDPDNEFLAMLLWYCDGIAANDTLRTVDGRVDELSARGGIYYSELNKGSVQYYGSDNILELYRLVNHAIEEVIKTRLVRVGKMEASRPATDVPIIIFEHLKELVHQFMSRKAEGLNALQPRGLK